MKIEDIKVDQEAQPIWHCRQRAKIDKERERMIVMKRDAIIVRRRDTLRRTVGQKVEAWKGRDRKGEKGQIETDQTRPKKETLV